MSQVRRAPGADEAVRAPSAALSYLLPIPRPIIFPLLIFFPLLFFVLLQTFALLHPRERRAATGGATPRRRGGPGRAARRAGTPPRPPGPAAGAGAEPQRRPRTEQCYRTTVQCMTFCIEMYYA